jgi:hypothetical protein
MDVEVCWPFAAAANSQAYIRAGFDDKHACRLTLGSRHEISPGGWIEKKDPSSLPRLFRSVPAGVKAALRFTTSRNEAVHFGPGPDAELLLSFLRKLRDRIAPYGVKWPAEALAAMTEDDWRDLLRDAGAASLGLGEPASPVPGLKPWQGPRP